jgi:peptide/nickel transport system substrate-binding protein
MGSGIAGREHYFIFHAPLTAYDSSEQLLARVAEKVPGLQDGDWKLLPDGGMEVTWKLRPNVVWHDGTPLAAEDFVLGFQIARDPELALAAVAPQVASIAEVRAADARTVVMLWKERSVFGNVNGHDGVPAVPRHIFGELYAQGDKAAFENSPYWTSQWIGLGPYKMTRWERGSFIEATAFDEYFLGRPKIGRIVIRYIGDATALVANVLSGDVDVVPSGAQLDVSQLVAVREAWGRGRTGGQSFVSPKGVRTLWLQFRNPTPWTQDVRVRQALQHALDRDTLVNTMLSGAVPRMDFYVPLQHPVHGLAEQRGLPRYLYDPERAQRLLAEVGWTRGPDGLLRSQAGELFPRIDVASSPSGDNVPEAAAVAGIWSAAGFQSVPTPWSATAGNVNEVRANHPGAIAFPWNFTNLAPTTLTSDRIGTAANRWTGGNYGGYANPEYDRVSAQFLTALEASQRQELLFGIVKIMAEEIPVIPLYLVANPSLARAGVEGVGEVPAEQASSTWNIHAWDYRG